MREKEDEGDKKINRIHDASGPSDEDLEKTIRDGWREKEGASEIFTITSFIFFHVQERVRERERERECVLSGDFG